MYRIEPGPFCPDPEQKGLDSYLQTLVQTYCKCAYATKHTRTRTLCHFSVSTVLFFNILFSKVVNKHLV